MNTYSRRALEKVMVMVKDGYNDKDISRETDISESDCAILRRSCPSPSRVELLKTHLKRKPPTVKKYIGASS